MSADSAAPTPISTSTCMPRAASTISASPSGPARSRKSARSSAKSARTSGRRWNRANCNCRSTRCLHSTTSARRSNTWKPTSISARSWSRCSRPSYPPAKASLSRRLFVTLLQFLRPHHVLRPRDRCRTITPLLLFGVLPEPVHAALSEAKISTITHFARVPGKELPQEAPSSPVPVCPPPTLADLHDAHPHPSFARRQHSAHVENSPAPHDATVLQIGKIVQF